VISRVSVIATRRLVAFAVADAGEGFVAIVKCALVPDPRNFYRAPSFLLLGLFIFRALIIPVVIRALIF